MGKSIYWITNFKFGSTLKEFQKTTFAQKTFIIDTDVLLNCIVKENDLNKTYVRLIKELKSYGCKLIIPDEVITEVLKHGDAQSNYNYIKNTFGSVDENIVSEQIHNVFVKGYYTGIINNTITPTTSFKQYLSNNYIDASSPTHSSLMLLIIIFLIHFK